MVDLSRPWPLGLGEKRWWQVVVAALVLLAVAVVFDHRLSLWATGWPAPIRGALTEITPYGESAWILYPAGILFVVTALVALFVRWKLMRTMLWQFAALYAFIFLGVGLPSLAVTLIKRVVGRGRPMHFDQTGLFGFHPNWLDWSYQSFPSGHSTTAFALAASVGFISERWFYPALALAAAIGLSRITEGVHYPSDVVAGAISGLLGAYFVRWAFARRGWLFDRQPDGRILMRPMSSLKRYLALKKRDIAGAPRRGRP
jgi:undecaprenyl-diphosphatase